MARSRSLLWALVVGLSLAFAAAPATVVEAKGKSKKVRKKKKKKKKAKKKAPAKPKAADTRAIGELMGEFEFGMSPKKVLTIIYKRIDAKYKEKIAATTDVYEQDKLRAKAKKEKKKIKKSYIKFDGQKTGWDVSIIDAEFEHKNDEAMLIYWERDEERGTEQRRFLFFVDSQLYKMYIAFDAKMFPPEKRKFAYFHQIMENRYGPGELVFSEDRYGEQTIRHLYWKDSKYYVRAINKIEFYGTFCLALADTKVVDWIGDRRAERNPEVAKKNVVIDSVTEGDEDSTTLTESNESAVDHIIRDK